MGKMTLREIGKSLGRYLAILAIVALGVGFFCGLRLTKTAMLRTLDQYVNELSLYDDRLVSTLGLTQDDVAAAAAQPGVQAAEGSVSVDVLGSTDGRENLVFKCITLPQKINTLRVDAGRLPARADECAADAWSFSEADIGKTLTISPGNDADTRDQFRQKSFTIVGIVHTPIYINYERGGASIGSGSVAAFFYVEPAALDTDYYTDIYLTLSGAKGEVYSEAYDDAVEARQDGLESFLNGRVAQRHDSLLADAQAKLDDAKKTLDEKRQELADAKQELADGQKKLADGRQEYRDGAAELAENRQTAAKELADAKQKLIDAEAALAENRQTLADKKQELADAEKTLSDSAIQLQNGWEEYDAGTAELAQKRQEAEEKLAAGAQQIKSAESSLATGQRQLDQKKAALDAAMAQLPEDTSALPEDKQQQIEAQRAQLQAGYAQLEQAQARLNESSAELSAAGAQYNEQKAAAEAELAAAQQKLDDAKAELDKNQQAYEDAAQKLADGKTQLADGEAKLSAAAQALQDGWTEYSQSAADTDRKLSAAAQKLTDAKTELDGSEAKLAAAQKQLLDGEAQLSKGEREYAAAEDKLSQIENGEGYVLTRSSNVGYVCFQSDSDIVRGVSRVFPLFFFLVAALVCITTMTRMVDEQRTQIGVLKALGYGKGAIFSQYLFYAGSASVLGCAAGALLGSYFLPKMIWQAYNIMYGFADILWAFDWPLVLVSSLAFLACALLATWYACNQELSRPAAELMRPKSPKAGRRVFLERIPFIWRRIPFLHKVSIRNILRYKKRMVMMAIGIGGCTALLLTGYGIRDSIANVVNYQYEEITKYDMAVNFREPMDEQARAGFLEKHADVLGGCLFESQLSLDCSAGGVTKTVYAVAAEGNSTAGFVDLHDGSGAVAYPDDGQCVLNSGLAEALNVGAGDTVTLRDSNNGTVSLTVSGVFDNYVYNYVYMTTDTFNAAFGGGQVKLALVCAKQGADLHGVSAALAADADVSNVQVNVDLRSRIGNMLSSLNYIVLVVIVCAGALAFIVLYNLTNINITERLREIATIKVLGFYEPETNSYVFRENIVLTVLGILVGYPMGIWLHRYVMEQIKIDMVAFDVRIAPLSYLYAAAFTIVFSLIVNFVMRFRIRAIDMAEALKSAE